MSADRFEVTLHPTYNMRELGKRITNLDPEDPTMLRDMLEAMVEERMGTLRLDLSQFRIRVRVPGSSIVCWCVVTTAGRTVVTR